MNKRTYDKNKSLSEANKIENINDRILFLKKEVKEFNQQDGWVIDIDNFVDAMNEEIKYLSELNKNNKTPNVKPVNPIWWQKSGRLLGYLIEELAILGYIDRNTDINKVIKEHFIDKDKNPFKDSIKQNRSGTGINKNSKPKGHKDIDNILNNLKE